MKKLIKTLLREGLVREMSDDLEELWLNTTKDVLSQIAAGQKLTFDLIPKNQYYKALQEFVKTGKILIFPVKHIESWKYGVLTNIMKLNSTTEIFGHTNHFPWDEFSGVFDYNQKTGEERNGQYTSWLKKKHRMEPENIGYKNYHSFYAARVFLEKVYHIDNIVPTFTNGQYMVSDYGLEPLLKLAEVLDNAKTPEDILATINKILDVSHQRSDLAELFIEGGSASLDFISNN
jgi:hypothetical protein